MTLFAIDNTITTFPAAEQIPEGQEHFATEKELAAIASAWPADRLVQIWNSFAGVAGFGADLKPVKRFTDRTVACKRIWNAIQKLDGAGEAEASTAPEATAAAVAAPAKAAKGARKAAKAVPAKASKATKPAKKATTAPRESSKKEIVISMMSRKAGATLDEITAETGWARHTVRGFVSGMVVKKLDMKVESTKNADGQRTYRVTK